MANMVNIANLDHGKRSVCGLRGLRLVVMLNEQEDSEIQAYRFSRQIGSKAEAMRRLIKIGLEVERVATTGVEFGDQSPAEAENNSIQEKADAGNT